MHLIIGVDDSPFSTAAVDYVRKVSWPAGTTATVLCALTPIAVAAPEAYMVMAQELDELHTTQMRQLEKLAASAAEQLAASGITAKGRAEDGDPRVVLEDAARAEKADLVVVGSHGRTGLKKLVLGSVASHVVSHAPCSVLVVRRPAAS